MNWGVYKQEEKDRGIVRNLFNDLFKNVTIEYLPISGRTDLKITGCTTNNTGIYNIEIKERWFESFLYPTCFLEVEKYKELVKDSNYTPLYICIYNDWIMVWNLNKIDMNLIQKEIKLMNKKTYSNNKEKVEKEVYNLPLSLAKKYKRNNYAVH